MAKLSSGILGGISGKVGNVVGGRWRGIDYIRSKPASVKNPNTEAQQKQRMKFRLVMGLLRKIRPLVKTGFRNGAKNQTPMNRAASLNLKQAVTGEFPELAIDPEKFVFAQGSLSSGEQPDMDTSTPGSITFTWVNSAAGESSADDGALVLLYNTEQGQVIYRMNGASRSDESIQVDIPESWQGDTVAGYLAFRSETSKEVSPSQLISVVNIAE